MNIVYFGNDLYSEALSTLLTQGYKVMCCYVNQLGHCADQVKDIAQNNDIEILTHKPELHELEQLTAQGADLFFVAEYQWKVPIPNNLKYGVNLHCSLLPHGKGRTPIPYVIDHPDVAGISCHKLTHEIDSGDIILKHAIETDSEESFSTYCTKIHLHTSTIVNDLMTNFEQLFREAKPQTSHGDSAELNINDRIISLDDSVAVVRAKIKRFGYLGLLLNLNEQTCNVIGAEATYVNHSHPVGTVVIDNIGMIAFTLADGVVIIPKQGIQSAT